MSQRQGMNGKESDANRYDAPNADHAWTLDDAVEVTRRFMHDYHAGSDVSLWKGLMREDSVWLGTGSSILLGADVIVNHYKEFARIGTARIVREEYHQLRPSPDVAVVFGKLITWPNSPEAERERARGAAEARTAPVPPEKGDYLTLFSLTYAVDDDGLALLTQHYSFEMIEPEMSRRIRRSGQTANGGGRVVRADRSAMQVDARMALRIMNDMSQGAGGWNSPQMKAASFLVSRNSKFSEPASQRIAVRANSQIVYIDPRLMMYAESHGHRTQIVTLSKALSCAIPLGELAGRLPGYFYRVHRGYLVNVHYIAAIRRNEVELASGVVIPIPMPKYSATKKALEELIARVEREEPDDGFVS